jgi:transglutaminase-like putative cysteine protease
MSAPTPAPAGGDPAAALPPRPLSSYGLAAVAGLSLAITGQILWAALALHALAWSASLRWRARPRIWQRSPLVLNAALAAIALFSMSMWVRGAIALVALAHFAHLAQALQLVDARPRRSDFLLVALALFQMILAANLTDSVLFPTLLVLFVVAMVWTLVVHTLWSESLAAGEPWSEERALTPGLLRTTLGATGLSLVVAFAIFLVLPRVRSGALAAPSFLGTPQAGFSDRIALGDLGRIRQDGTVVLRVETLRGTPPVRSHAYWRGLAFDHFDGRNWSVTPSSRVLVSRAPDLGVDLARQRPPAGLVQRILREPVASGVLFSAGAPAELEGSVGRLERDVNGGLYAPETETDRVQYTITSAETRPSLPELREDHTAPPPGTGARELQLPPLSPKIQELAERITAGLPDDADRVAAIERYLQKEGRYSDQPPPERPGDPRSPVETFLLEDTAGHCEYFASGMVVLLRSLGIPARLVNGFAGGEENPIGGFVELARSDAHAWVEVHYARAGWVRYDPTPADARLRALSTHWFARLRNVGSALELLWFQHVVEFDRSHQMRALRAAWLAWRHWRGGPARQAGHARPAPLGPRFDPRALAPVLGIGLGAALLAFFLARGWRRRRGGPGVPPAYAEALRLLERQRGLVRRPAMPARDFARLAARQVPPAAAAAFWSLTEGYLEERFGGRRTPVPRRALRTLRDTLRRR